MRSRFFILYFLICLVLFPLGAKIKAKKVNPIVAVTKNSVSENDRSLFDYYFVEALNARHQNRFDEAFDLFSHCVEIDSLNPQAWFEIAVFYNNMKRTDLGLEAMEKAWRLDPQNDWYAMGLANVYLGMKKFDQAIFLYEGLLKTRSNDENLHYYLATLYSQSGRLQNAVQEFNKIEALIGKNEQITIQKFKLYQSLNKPKKAIHEVQELVNATPFDSDVLLLLGDSWLELGNAKEAFKVYESARKLDPSNPSVALSFADYYDAKGDSLTAKKYLFSALTNPETDMDTKLSIFTPILVESLSSADSVQIPEIFNLLLDQHPNDYKLREIHVQYLMEKGRKSEAKEELRTVLDLNPNQLETWKKLLQLCAEADNQQEIRKVCTDALNYFPNESIFWFYMGLSYYPETEEVKEETEIQAALGLFQKAANTAPIDDPSFQSRVYGLMGDAYMLLQDRQKAFQNYDKALVAHPGNVLVMNNYAYYLSEVGEDLTKAEMMSRKTIDADPKNPTFLDTYAWIFFKEERYSLAKIYIQRAIENEPDPSSIILEHYGDILWFNKEIDAAMEQWKKALELNNPSTELVKKVETGTYVKPQTK
jgi:tetratricopeptide (TPR) repeat protein